MYYLACLASTQYSIHTIDQHQQYPSSMQNCCQLLGLTDNALIISDSDARARLFMGVKKQITNSACHCILLYCMCVMSSRALASCLASAST